MPDNQSFLRNAVVFGLGGVATQVVSAILLPLYTYYLAPSDFGVLDLLQRTGGIVVLLLLGQGISLATFAFYCQANSAEQRRSIFSTITVLLVCLLSVGGVLGWLFSPWLADKLQIYSAQIITLGIVTVLLESFTTFPVALMQARVESFHYVIANLLMAISRILLIVGCVVWLEMGVGGVLVASAITYAVWGIVLMGREMSSGFPWPDFGVASQVIAFAMPLLPSGIMALALAGADRYFLVAYCGAGEVGLYALGARLATTVPDLAISPLWKVWTATLYRYYAAPDASIRVGRIIMRILFVQVLMSLGVCMMARELVGILAPAEYADASLVVPFLALASTLRLANNLFEGAFWSHRKTNWKPILMACSATVAVIAFSLLVPRFGSLGAAVALALAYAAHATLTFIVTQRIFPVLYDWRAVVVALVLAIMLYAASTFAFTSPGGAVIKFALWLAWPGLLWLLGIVIDEEKEWCLRQMARGAHWLSGGCR